MNKNKKVLLGMSGGVDSSVAAVLLKNQGYEVIGITMKLFKDEQYGYCHSLSSIEDAKVVCDYLEIPHYTINFEDDFKKYVVDDFISEYKKCRTPNPCIECNKHLKFGSLYEKAKELGCYYIATGHYAKIEYDNFYKRNVLKKANNIKKDQSYVLYSISQDLLDKILFPLGNFNTKEEIRKIATSYNLPIAQKPDSEDICFIPDGNYKGFLENNSNIKPTKGNIVNVKGEILGEHTGLYKYTVGQRKGLGISSKTPLFVVKLDSEKNEVIVGEEKDLYTKEFLVDDINILLDQDFENEINANVKTRYSTNEYPAKIYKINDKFKVIFDEPQRAITKGQSAVFYKNDIVIGGGKIV